jgi:hypothetical protein
MNSVIHKGPHHNGVHSAKNHGTVEPSSGSSKSDGTSPAIWYAMNKVLDLFIIILSILAIFVVLVLRRRSPILVLNPEFKIKFRPSRPLLNVSLDILFINLSVYLGHVILTLFGYVYYHFYYTVPYNIAFFGWLVPHDFVLYGWLLWMTLLSLKKRST